ncbi:MAG: MFS transporter [Isosphaeraceae bacterium]
MTIDDSPFEPTKADNSNALDRARMKAYFRLVPIVFLCYVIAYVDRNNVGLAAPNMTADMPAFNSKVIGFGSGLFFIGYFMLEIPGTLLVELWSARKWISRIMITWGFAAAATALVKTPWHFYLARFFLGLAEAGFFPGVIVYLTHWFPSRDRTRALSWFLIGTPIAQFISPYFSYYFLRIGTTEMLGNVAVHHPLIWGLKGWQWMFIGWGIPAVILGVVVLMFLTDRPAEARWLSDEEREALETELAREKARQKAGGGHMSLRQAFAHPKVLLLAAAYFFIVTGNYGVEIFLPSILKKWYSPSDWLLTSVLMIPPIGSFVGQLFIGWNSDRTKERRFHAALPIYLGAVALGLTIVGKHPLPLMIVLFTIAALGLKSYLPAFWSLPSLFLAEAAAAGSIGLINSVGNLGGFVGPSLLGFIEYRTHSYFAGIIVLCVSMVCSATIIVSLGLGRAAPKAGDSFADPLAEPFHESDAIIEPK